MKSANLAYFSRLDHLRLAASLWVFIFHLRFAGDFPRAGNDLTDPVEILKLWVDNGQVGVSLFLVLSGFLFCLIGLNSARPIRYLPFIYNRILRIFPLTTLLVFITISVGRADSTPLDVLRLLTLQLNTGGGAAVAVWGMEAYFPIGPVWTVAVEFQFYLLFPFIFAAYRAHGASRLALLILLMIATRLLLAGNSSDPDFHLTLYFTLIGRLDQFLIGMLLATYYYRRPHSPLPPLRCLMTSILTLAVFTAYFAHRGPPWLRQSLEPTIEALLCAALIYLYLRAPLPDWRRLDRLLAWLGGLSFSLYLSHTAIYRMMPKLGLAYPVSYTDLCGKTLLLLPLLIAYATLTYYIIEKPFNDKRIKYT